MKDNSNNPNHPFQFSAYRGIALCADWEDAFGAMTDAERYIEFHLGGSNLPGFTAGCYVSDDYGHLAKILWTPGKPEVFFDIGERLCDEAVPRLQQQLLHSVTSAVIFVETTQPLAFEDILTRCNIVQKAHPGLSTLRRGDWGHPRKKGRSFSVGSRSSACQVVLQQQAPMAAASSNSDEEELVRLEWRFRLEDEKLKACASKFDAHEFISLSPMGAQLADLVLTDGLIRHTTDSERTDAVIGTYAQILQQLNQDDLSREVALSAMEAGMAVLKQRRVSAAAGRM
jgi:hypothetical protein